jgi:hypothetical protein
MNIKRYAIITTTSERDNVAAYLPSNYEVIYREPSQVDYAREHWQSVVIAGTDNAGWTLDDYVLPRLASGMFHGKEIDLSHEIMQRVPDSAHASYVIAGYVYTEDGTLYWSNLDGWVDLSTATVFTERDRHDLHLPIGDPGEHEPRWVKLPS